MKNKCKTINTAGYTAELHFDGWSSCGDIGTKSKNDPPGASVHFSSFDGVCQPPWIIDVKSLKEIVKEWDKEFGDKPQEEG